MKTKTKKLATEQIDKKLEQLLPLQKSVAPERGWVYTIRTTLKMSLRQLGERLKISAPSVNEMEIREANGSLTIKSLRMAADALNMHLVYGFVPKGDSIEEMIDRRAYELAKEIVMRTDTTMRLEGQGVSAERLKKSIQSKAEEFKRTMPRFLWD